MLSPHRFFFYGSLFFLDLDDPRTFVRFTQTIGSHLILNMANEHDMKTFDDYLKETKLSGYSPEAAEAELAWKNALLEAAIEFKKRGLYGHELLLHWAEKA